MEDARILNAHDRRAGTLQSGHVALELVMKAVISRQKGCHPDGHELNYIAGFDIDGWSIASMMLANRSVSEAFTDVESAWCMQMRYVRVPRSSDDVRSILTTYEAVFKWIQTLIG